VSNAFVEPRVRFRDNPIGIAQARRRLRRKQALPTFAVVLLLSLSAAFYGSLTGEWMAVRSSLLVLIGTLLFLTGVTQVAATVSEDRRSRLLDFHRATPTTPWTDALGYAIGSAAREYVACAVVLPFAIAATLLAGRSLLALGVGLLEMLLCGWLYHAFAMNLALSSNRKRIPQSAGLLIALLYLVVLPLSRAGTGVLAQLTPIPTLSALGIVAGGGNLARLTFYGAPISPLAFGFFAKGYLIAFLFWSAARKLRREGAHAFTRYGALAFFAITEFVWLGPLWAQLHNSAIVASGAAVFAAIALGLACALGASLAPQYLEYARCVRRAARHATTPHWSEEGASAAPLVPAFAGLVWLGTAAVVALPSASPGPAATLLSAKALLMTTCSVAVLAFAIGAIEFLRLGMRGAAKSGTFLVGFVTLVLPWIAGAIVMAASLDRDLAYYAFACSPVFAGVGSIGLWAGALALDPVDPLRTHHVVFSCAVTSALAAWFLVRGAALRRAIRAGTPAA
jgi:hypothetical protein